VAVDLLKESHDSALFLLRLTRFGTPRFCFRQHKIVAAARFDLGFIFDGAPYPKLVDCCTEAIMSANDEYNDMDNGDEMGNAGPGAPTPLTALEGVGGLTKRDIQLIIDGGYNTVESVAYTPRRVLEQIKGISEQKAGKILAEGEHLW